MSGGWPVASIYDAPAIAKVAMLIHSISSVAPLLLLMLAGFCIARLRWCGKQGMDFLAKINMEIAIPPYLFLAAINAFHSPDEVLELFYSLSYPLIFIAAGIAFSWVTVWFLGIKPPYRGIFINTVTFSNVVLMGMPIAISLFGDGAIHAIMIIYTANTLLFWTAGIWFIRRDLNGARSIGILSVLKRVFTSRPLISFSLGLICVLFDLSVPQVIVRSCTFVGGMVTPAAMIFIGCVIRFASFKPFRDSREFRTILIYRYTVVPLLSGLMCYFLPMDVIYKKVFFLLCNMPAMAQFPVATKETGGDYETASVVVATTTVLSMAGVPVTVYFMESVRFFG